jgi:hypothetical protein
MSVLEAVATGELRGPASGRISSDGVLRPKPQPNAGPIQGTKFEGKAYALGLDPMARLTVKAHVRGREYLLRHGNGCSWIRLCSNTVHVDHESLCYPTFG